MNRNGNHPIRWGLLSAGAALCLVLSGCFSSGVNLPPVVVIEAWPLEGYAPFDTVLDASSSFDPEGRVLMMAWDFGDGATASGAVVSHTYYEPGDYGVRVTATDPDGAQSSEMITIHVREVPDGYTLRRFEWERDGEPRIWEVLIPFDLYQYYKGLQRIPYVDNYRYGDYVEDPLDDPTLEDYAIALWNRVDQDREEFILETLAFVQGAIQYKADPVGVEHPLYPLETLADGVGDCEDTSILFVSLIKALDTAINTVDIPCKLAFVDTGEDGIPDHVLAFVAIPNRLVNELPCGSSATTFEWDGWTFALAETAVDHGVYALGCDPWHLDESDIAELWSFPHP
jgi:PKD repeat protein